ncbi:conserved exported protein of unknown function [Tenacibaculum sp. 190130A14a]|uniref:Uncharacterized protein n=1 Tax=Tenacibaculum polynesiense TaxID=3137857 RepID=A0ABP1F428_9FLAO
MRHNIIKLSCIIFFGIFTPFFANAQFGGIMKKVKQNVVDKTTKKYNSGKNTNSSSKQDESKENELYSDSEYKLELARKYPNDKQKQEYYYKKYKEFQQKKLNEQEKLLANTNKKGKVVNNIPSPIDSEVQDKFKDNEIYILNGVKFRKIPSYNGKFYDKLDLSGYYHLSQYFVRYPSSHFDREPGRIYEGFSIEYNPNTYELKAYFDPVTKRHGVIPKQYRESADKGNIQFQFGIGDGPEWTNVNALLLEPGVLLIGAEVYYKNKKEGHKWMNNIEPKQFVIASKDPAKILKYYRNPELTSQVTFAKFDSLLHDSENFSFSKLKMPSKGNLNNNLIGIATKGLNNYYSKTSMKNLKQYITSNRWSTVKHKITGIPQYQWAVGAVIQKNSDGQCMLQQFIIRRDYEGGGKFGTAFFNGISRTGKAPYGSYCKCIN